MIALAAPARVGAIVVGARTVGWTEWGPVDGTPIVFCTGAGMTSAMGFGADVVEALGVRLICVDRPGLGRSAPDPDKDLGSVATDVGSVLGQLGVDRAGAVGFSQGAPFAFALAGTGRISALAIVAGTDELAHPAMRPLVAPDMLRFLDAIAADARAFEASFATQVDAAGLWSLILAMSGPEDRAIYQEAAFAAAYERTLVDGFAQGPEGYVRDFVLASQRWSTPPEAISVPVTLWYGRRDTSPVHSPDHGQTLASRCPHARLRILEAEGASLLWTQARAILEDLVAATVRP